MPRALTWATGLAASALLHAAAGGLYLATRTLDAPPTQERPQSKLQLDTVTAPRQTAQAQAPESQTAAQAQTASTTLPPDTVPQSRAQPVSTAQNALPAARPPASTLAEAPSTSTQLPATKTTVAPLPPTQLPQGTTSATTLPSTQASAASPTTTALTTTNAPSVPAQAGAVTADTARPVQATTAPLPEAQAQQITVTPAALPRTQATASTPTATALATTQTPSAQVAAAQVTPTSARPVQATAATLPQIAAQTAPLATLAPRAEVAQTAALDPQTAPAARPATQTADPAQPASSPAASAQPDIQTAALAPTSGDTPREPPLPTTSAKAELAWQFGDRLVTDPTALSTIQAFMTPEALDAGQVRDDLSSVLTGIDCARLSATFLPETGTLEMRGHIPDPSLREPILAALQAQVGDGIPVTANLLHLPSPQCGALTGIAEVGLPQSTDQFTNTRLIGTTAHAREYTYSEGQRLTFDLVAPDYDAYVYVDYFNADGEVIHLAPNDTIALELAPAKSRLGIGQDRPGKPSLRITIGPPFGQEIAVAFAASKPLFDGVRPIVEPAEPYLAFLKGRVAEARASDPDFKGEWVYFFISTQAATQ